MLKMPKTRRGARKQADALINQYRRAFSGGGSFGFDWPTFRMNSPDVYNHLEAIRKVYSHLPA